MAEPTNIMPGLTIVLVDVSESMKSPVSPGSDLGRLDAACELAAKFRELAEFGGMFTSSKVVVGIDATDLYGADLAEVIKNSQEHGPDNLYQALKVLANGYQGRADRLIVITDEQSHDTVPDPFCRGYMINVASEKNGVGYGAWTHINGWSEAVVDYILKIEEGFNQEKGDGRGQE